MLALVILDGFGERKTLQGNAIKQAKMPNYKKLKKDYPFTLLRASEGSVGLVSGQPGNSEAGHTNMGAGYIVKQDLKIINDAIKNRSFDENKVLNNTFKHVKDNNSNLHIMGLYSNGGVHSKIKHLKTIIRLAKNSGVKNIYLHLFTDGRDVPFASGKEIFLSLDKFVKTRKYLHIASISGRVYAMDREQRYDRVKTAYDAIVNAKAKYCFEKTNELFDYFYSKKIYDEFIPASIIGGGKQIENGDGVIFFNYRSDRARELTSAIIEPEFSGFKTKKLSNVTFATMTQYSDDFVCAKPMYSFSDKNPSVGEIFEKNHIRQFRCSETTKYAHITFFFNGGREEPFVNETRKLIESKNVLSFDEFPPMRAREITDEVVSAIDSKKYDFVLTNISNCDMIGHTGNFDATIQTVEIVDECIGRIAEVCKKVGADLVITADHGNADVMIDKYGKKLTAHSFSKVPFLLVSEKYKKAKLESSLTLSSIAPTLLKILNIKKPSFMTSESILK